MLSEAERFCFFALAGGAAEASETLLRRAELSHASAWVKVEGHDVVDCFVHEEQA